MVDKKERKGDPTKRPPRPGYGASETESMAEKLSKQKSCLARLNVVKTVKASPSDATEKPKDEKDKNEHHHQTEGQDFLTRVQASVTNYFAAKNAIAPLNPSTHPFKPDLGLTTAHSPVKKVYFNPKTGVTSVEGEESEENRDFLLRMANDVDLRRQNRIQRQYCVPHKECTFRPVSASPKKKGALSNRFNLDHWSLGDFLERNQRFWEERNEKLSASSQRRLDETLQECTFHPMVSRAGDGTLVRRDGTPIRQSQRPRSAPNSRAVSPIRRYLPMRL